MFFFHANFYALVLSADAQPCLKFFDDKKQDRQGNRHSRITNNQTAILYKQSRGVSFTEGYYDSQIVTASRCSRKRWPTKSCRPGQPFSVKYHERFVAASSTATWTSLSSTTTPRQLSPHHGGHWTRQRATIIHHSSNQKKTK